MRMIPAESGQPVPQQYKPPKRKRVKAKPKNKKFVSIRQAEPSCIDDLIPLAAKKADSIVETKVKNGEVKDATQTWNRAYHLTMNLLCRRFGFR